MKKRQKTVGKNEEKAENCRKKGRKDTKNLGGYLPVIC